jgi:GMP synthase (glutamine-hydrolysing)
MGPMRALVLQHIACEPPGLYEEILIERSVAIDRVELDEGDPLPDWHGFDLIIAMGGPMSVNDDATLPWLPAEKRLIAEAVRAGVPFFGACLGAQLLAAALGAHVYAGPAPEVGVMTVSLTEAGLHDPVTSELPQPLVTVQFHGDTFDVPDGGICLARSAAYPNQAFSWKQAYGVQFHLEVTAPMVAGWLQVPAYAACLERTLGPGGGRKLLRDVESQASALSQSGRHLFSHWMDLAVPSSAPLRV